MYGLDYLLLRFIGGSPFRNLTVSAEARKRQFDHHPSPEKTYCILLTPRSGSSRLADILTRTGVLGVPREYFNPVVIPGAAQSMNADTLDDYVAMLRRMRCQGGVFGFRITYRQLLGVFHGDGRFHAAFPDAAWFWLIREDIVAQAVSASRMVQTDLRHLEKPEPERKRQADARFQYRPRDIKWRIRQLRWMERRTERFFRRYAIHPVRLSHERLLRLPPRDAAGLFAGRLSIELPDDIDPVTEHAKVSAGKSAEFTRRFRAENATWLARVDAARAPMLALLEPLGAVLQAAPGRPDASYPAPLRES